MDHAPSDALRHSSPPDEPLTHDADLVIANARIITLAGGETPRRGRSAMRDLHIIDAGDVAVRDGHILVVGRSIAEQTRAHQVIDAGGRVLMPGFIDCHTHACWSGDRLDEFEQKIGGADYLSILTGGGGIMSTVRAVRSASISELVRDTNTHLARMLTLGTTTAEVKTGYGLNTITELKMLQAIRTASESFPRIAPTFLGAHAIDRDQADFVEKTITETLPAMVQVCPGITCDAYCEEGVWCLEDTRRLFETAAQSGCPLRIHTDQFHSLGATKMALEMNAVSVDHLEATTDEDVRLIARAAPGTSAVVLPSSGFNTDGRYAPARKLIDEGAVLAIASNYNPGSAPCPSMPFALALACRMLKLTPAEALTAATVNAAHVLGLSEVTGRIVPGLAADLVLWDETDERAVCYEFAGVPASMVVANGRIIMSNGNRCEI